MGFSSQSNLLFFQRRAPNIFPQLLKPFSSLPEPQQPLDSPSPSPPKPSSLSARMSFVFDQIDQIKREHADKDQTLQRIRAWREAKHQIAVSKTAQDAHFAPNAQNEQNEQNAQNAQNGRNDRNAQNAQMPRKTNVPVVVSETRGVMKEENGKVGSEKGIVLRHPWPEWMELIERLVKQNYFDCRRRDEDRLIESSGFRLDEEIGGGGEEEKNQFSDYRTVETAVLNFGRDRFDIIRGLSRMDLQILVGYGCPNSDKRSAYSAKVLRKYVHLDEGDVCSACSLRTSCNKAYLLTNKEDEARTTDVMRILLEYGFDPISRPITNKPLLKLKKLKSVVRRLIHEVVKLSAAPIDPNLPPPIFKKPPPKIKQPPLAPKKRVGNADVEMKKGDWLCVKCDFMNFAKNTICLQCDAKRPKRELLPGEWECPQCNFLNYRRNVVCFHCECKRPQDEYMESQSHIPEKKFDPGMRTAKVLSREEVTNAWNFNFDDDESDGADVAAFEYADSNKLHEDRQGGYDKSGQKTYERITHRSTDVDPATGFNDFSDNDDVDNYELDNRNEAARASRVNFTELQADSESDSENSNSSRHAPQRTSLLDRKKLARPGNPRFARSEDAELDFGSDDDLPVHPNWKSSQATNPRQSSRHGDALSYGSDDERMDGGFSSSRKVQGRQGGNRNRSSDFESDDEQVVHRAKRTGAGSRGDYSREGAPRGGRGSNDRRGNSQSFRGGQATDSYYDQERFKRPRVNVR